MELSAADYIRPRGCLSGPSWAWVNGPLLIGWATEACNGRGSFSCHSRKGMVLLLFMCYWSTLEAMTSASWKAEPWYCKLRPTFCSFCSSGQGFKWYFLQCCPARYGWVRGIHGAWTTHSIMPIGSCGMQWKGVGGISWSIPKSVGTGLSSSGQMGCTCYYSVGLLGDIWWAHAGRIQ